MDEAPSFSNKSATNWLPRLLAPGVEEPSFWGSCQHGQFRVAAIATCAAIEWQLWHFMQTPLATQSVMLANDRS